MENRMLIPEKASEAKTFCIHWNSTWFAQEFLPIQDMEALYCQKLSICMDNPEVGREELVSELTIAYDKLCGSG